MLAGSLDGQPLAAEVAALRKLEAAGQAQIIQVEHHIGVGYVGDDDCVVFDRYVDHSYIVDAKTRQPVDSGPGQTR